MAIKTISQLENGRDDLFYNSKGGTGIGVNATNKTKNTFIEVSIPKDNNDNPTSFTSKKLKLADLSTLIEYSIFNEQCELSGEKIFLNKVTANRDLEVNGDFHVNKNGKTDTSIYANAEDVIFESTKQTDIIGGSNVCIKTKTTTPGIESGISITEKNNINLSSDGKIIEKSNTQRIQFTDRFVIEWINSDGYAVPLISCYHDQVTFTNLAKVQVLGNDLTCTATAARWS